MSFGLIEQSGQSVAVKDEGITLTTGATVLDFQGSGVTASSGSPSTEIAVSIPGGSGATPVRNETPSGTVNGINDTFTVAHTPLYGLSLTVNGQLQTFTTQFTLATATITFTTGNIPQTGDIIRAAYEY